MLGKRLINSNSAAAGGPCTTDTLQILGDTSCVAYYKMSDATDESGNYDGTPTNVNFNVAGKFGPTGEFDGSSSFIDVNAKIPVSLNFSFSFWMNSTDSTTGQYMFSTKANSGTNGYWIVFNPDSFMYGEGNNSANGVTQQSPTGNYDDGNWHHVVVTRASGGTVNMFIDNNHVITNGSIGANHMTSTAYQNDLFIGRYSGSNALHYGGKIDSIRIFDKVISSSEVTTLYNEVYCQSTIVPTEHFNTVLYPGNGSSQNIDTVGFQPDFTFIKNRNAANPNALFDSVRGAGKLLVSNTTANETGNSGDLLGSFRPLGFQVNRSYLTNTAYDTTNGLSNLTYVAWNWRAAGFANAFNVLEGGTVTTSSSAATAGITAGTITTGWNVSANRDAGFSIVKSTYTSTANYTVGHGLSQRPEIVFNKNLDDNSGSYGQWWTWIEGVTGTNGDYIRLNGTVAKSAFSDTFTTNTTIKYHTGFQVTGTNKSMISYAFHSVDGYSKIGSYVGNDSTDGPNIVTGFRPAFVMFKATNATGGNTYWVILDNKRDGVNTKRLYANASFAEDPAEQVDFLSNGFKIKTNNSDINSNFNYMFLAFAEEVFTPITRNATNPFGDGSERALYKLESDGTDSEGNYTTTTLPNVTFATGYIGNAAVFNGSSSYIGIAGDSFNYAAMTLSCWFNLDSTSQNYQTIFNNYSQTGSENRGWYIRYETGGNLRLRGYSDSNVEVSNILQSTTINAGTWYHLAVTISSSQVKIYQDSNLINTTSLSAAIGYSGTGGFPTIGSYRYSATNAGNYFDGSIDQLRVFNKSLDDGEVMALYLE